MLQERSASPLRSLRRARPFGSSHGGPDLDDGRGYLVLTENRRKMSRTSPQPACYSGHVPRSCFPTPSSRSFTALQNFVVAIIGGWQDAKTFCLVRSKLPKVVGCFPTHISTDLIGPITSLPGRWSRFLYCGQDLVPTCFVLRGMK